MRQFFLLVSLGLATVLPVRAGEIQVDRAKEITPVPSPSLVPESAPSIVPRPPAAPAPSATPVAPVQSPAPITPSPAPATVPVMPPAPMAGPVQPRAPTPDTPPTEATPPQPAPATPSAPVPAAPIPATPAAQPATAASPPAKVAPDFSVYYRTWQLFVPGTTYITLGSTPGYATLTTSFGTGILHQLSLYQDQTFVWRSKAGEPLKGQWVAGTDDYPIVLKKAYEGKDWRVGLTVSSGTLTVWDGFTWFEAKLGQAPK